MQIDPSIFKSYDIRGVYPTQINEENIKQIAKAILKFYQEKLNKDNPTILLAYDMRLSGPQLFKAVKETLVEYGANVVDAGQLSTPSFYFAVFHYKYDAGIQVTASHNPKEWNGMKFVILGEKGLIKIGQPTGMEDVKKYAIEGLEPNKTDKGSLTTKEGILEDEVVEAKKLVDVSNLKKLKVVADTGNAMGAQYVEALFKTIPGELIKMNFNLDGSFPVHEPNPLKFETLVDLQKKVVEEKADLGIATDGDADRLFFIDEKGEIVPSTSVTSIVARSLLKQYPGELIYFDIRDILGPIKLIEEFGGKYEIVRVGHAYITEAMNKTGGIFAGESSGHMFFRVNGNAEWNLPIILTILKVISDEGKPLSEIMQEVKRSYEMPEINFEVNNSKEILDSLMKKYSDGKYWDIDGVSISYDDWRFNVRTSNTEPLLRLNVEGYDKEKVKEKYEELKSFIKSIAK